MKEEVGRGKIRPARIPMDLAPTPRGASIQLSNICELSSEATEMTRTIESPFLSALWERLEKRGKSIRRQVDEFKMDKVLIIEDGEGKERLDVFLKIGNARNTPTIRINVWDDRWISIDVRKWSKSGWEWSWSLNGRFISKDPARSLVHLIENTISISRHVDKNDLIAFDRQWSAVLAKGPSTA